VCVCVCVCVCACVCVCVCMCVCAVLHGAAFSGVSTCQHNHTQAQTYIPKKNKNTSAHILSSAAFFCASICTQIHAHTHTYTHTHVCVLVRRKVWSNSGVYLFVFVDVDLCVQGENKFGPWLIQETLSH